MAMLRFVFKRAFSSSATRVFANPMRDSVFKYMMTFENCRISLLSALTPYKNIESVQILTNDLRPLYQKRNLLNNFTKAVEEPFSKEPNNIDALISASKNLSDGTFTLTDGKGVVHSQRKQWTNIYEGLKKWRNVIDTAIKNQKDIHAALFDKKLSSADFVCKLTSGEIVMVEVQIEKFDYQDARFLAYNSYTFGNQLISGEGLQNVIGVSILQEGFSWNSCVGEYKRHYKMVDTISNGIDQPDETRMAGEEGLDQKSAVPAMPFLQMIQYDLSAVQQENIPDENERYWLEFFNDAKDHDSVPEQIPEALVEAYNKIRMTSLPARVKMEYEKEESAAMHTTIRDAEIFEKGKAEGKAETIRSLTQSVAKGLITQDEADVVIRIVRAAIP